MRVQLRLCCCHQCGCLAENDDHGVRMQLRWRSVVNRYPECSVMHAAVDCKLLVVSHRSAEHFAEMTILFVNRTHNLSILGYSQALLTQHIHVSGSLSARDATCQVDGSERCEEDDDGGDEATTAFVFDQVLGSAPLCNRLVTPRTEQVLRGYRV